MIMLENGNEEVMDDSQQSSQQGAPFDEEGPLFTSFAPLDPSTPEEDTPEDTQDNDGDDDKPSSKEKNDGPEICCCCRRFCQRWPRLCVVVFGLVLPLWALIILSVILGTWLSHFELPGEIERNNIVLRARSESTLLTNVMVQTTAAIPKICWQLFLQQNEQNINRTLLGELLSGALNEAEEEYSYNATTSSPADNTPQIPLNDDIIIFNSTELTEFMEECGQTAVPFVAKLLDRARNASQIAFGEDLSFNWIRCVNSSQDGSFRSEFRRESQEIFFTEAWEIQQQSYLADFLQEYPNTTLGRFQAYEASLEKATGGDDCSANKAASAWFWFTVMTTVGYGNQAPTTTGGRTLVYTLGFLSILAFGVILARAGYIASVFLDNLFRMIRPLKERYINLMGALCWGLFHVTWMLYMAYYVNRWKGNRLGDDIDFELHDGYWFAYISTTTVGLGDYYLEPEGLVMSDLFSFSLIYLIGFTFLSAFLSSLAALFSRERKDFIEKLLDKLKADEQ